MPALGSSAGLQLCASASPAGTRVLQGRGQGGRRRDTDASEVPRKLSWTSQLSPLQLTAVHRGLQPIPVRTAQLRPAAVPDSLNCEK